MAKQRLSRFNDLLGKTSVYTNFLKEKLEVQKAKRREERKGTTEGPSLPPLTNLFNFEERSDTWWRVLCGVEGSSSSSSSSRGTNHKTKKRKLEEEDEEVEPPRNSSSKQTRAGGGDDEGTPKGENEDEDVEVEDDEEAQERRRKRRQPNTLTGGVLREYQLQGFEWLV